MGDNSTDIRKYLNVLQENGPLAPGVFDDPMAAPVVDPAMDDPMDDAPTTGPETKIEVTMKDGDEVEVEVYAQQGDELKRLMDLAGMFHKDKQNGTLGGDMGAETPMNTGSSMVAMDPIASISDIPPAGGPDVPVGADIAPDMGMEPMDMEPDVAPDMAPDMGMGDAPEIDFALDDEPSDEMMYEETNVKKHDYGYPNPEIGQEEYELKAFDHSGGASKPVRAVPARSGDNPMVNMSDKRSLRSYMQEVDSKKKS